MLGLNKSWLLCAAKHPPGATSEQQQEFDNKNRVVGFSSFEHKVVKKTCIKIRIIKKIRMIKQMKGFGWF